MFTFEFAFRERGSFLRRVYRTIAIGRFGGCEGSRRLRIEVRRFLGDEFFVSGAGRKRRFSRFDVAFLF